MGEDGGGGWGERNVAIDKNITVENKHKIQQRKKTRKYRANHAYP